jgi:hypothetical protein
MNVDVLNRDPLLAALALPPVQQGLSLGVFAFPWIRLADAVQIRLALAA